MICIEAIATKVIRPTYAVRANAKTTSEIRNSVTLDSRVLDDVFTCTDSRVNYLGFLGNCVRALLQLGKVFYLCGLLC